MYTEKENGSPVFYWGTWYGSCTKCSCNSQKPSAPVIHRWSFIQLDDDYEITQLSVPMLEAKPLRAESTM